MDIIDGEFLLWLLAQLLAASFVLQLIRRKTGRSVVLGAALLPILLAIGSLDALGENSDSGMTGGFVALIATFFALVGLVALLWTLNRDRRDHLRGFPAQLTLLAAIAAASTITRLTINSGRLMVAITVVAAVIAVAIGRMDPPFVSQPTTDDELAAEIRTGLRDRRDG